MSPSSRSCLVAVSALLFLLGWGLQSGCAVEDTVATIIDPDGSVGPFDEETGAQGGWPDAGPDEAPDGGSPEAGTAR